MMQNSSQYNDLAIQTFYFRYCTYHLVIQKCDMMKECVERWAIPKMKIIVSAFRQYSKHDAL